jgi:hypothetical protein
MKLIRITSDDDNGIFETQFNQSINIKPFSKIALNNLNANLKPIIIDSVNESVTFTYNTDKVANDKILTARITNEIYTRNNYGDLLDQITNGLNGDYLYKDKVLTYLLGNQIRATVIDEVVNIEMRVAPNSIDWATNDLYSTKSPSILAPTGSSTVWSMVDTIGSTATYVNGIYSNFNVAKGVGYFRFQINKLVQDTSLPGGVLKDQGFLIGLSKSVFSDFETSDVDEDDITYGIGVGWNGTGWTMYGQQGGVIDDFNQAPTYASEGDITNSVLEVRVNGSFIQLCYSIGGAKPVVVERTYTHISKTELYPFIIFHSNELYTRASYPETTLDPYVSGITTDVVRDYRVPLTQKVFSVPTRNRVTQKQLKFSNIAMANFLGYSKSTYLIPTDSFSTAFVNFQSDTIFYPAINSRNFILELITFNIDSYDSSQKQRRNILSSVISSDENEVITTEPNVIFLDMINSEPLDVRNLTLRLVDTEYNPVKLSGKSTLTILIADANERSF